MLVNSSGYSSKDSKREPLLTSMEQVNSSETSMMEGSWPYASHGLPNSIYRNGLSPYASMSTSTQWPGPMHGMHGFASTTYPYGARQSYPSSTYSTSLPDDMFQGYSLQQQSSGYHPPITRDSPLPSLDYLSPEVSRQWPSVTPTLSRQAHHGISLDQENSHTRLTQPQTTSAFGLGSLETNLPTFIPPRSRTLPMPDRQRTSISHSSILSSDNPLSGASQTLSYRSSLPWMDKGGTESNETSNSSTSSGLDPASSNASSSPHATQKATSFSVHGIPSSSTGREIYYSPPSATTSIGLPSGEDQLESENASFQGRLNREHGISNHQPSSSHYGYSLGRSTRAGASNHLVADGTLMNGELYTRLEPQSAQSYEDAVPALSGGPSNAYRSPISSRSNARY